MLKDKPIYAPLRVLRPGWFADPSRFSLWWAFGWWFLVQGFTWLEPLPTDLQIQFDLQYLALTHLCAIAGQLLLPIFAIGLVPKSQPGGRILTLLRLSMGASLWFLWTFPLAFVFTGSQGSIALALGRELFWAISLSIGIVGLRSNRTGFRKLSYITLCSVGFFIGSIGFATLPDLSSLSHLKMDNIGTGRICQGIPALPQTQVDSADWLVSGDPKTVSAERLSLGDRQRVLGGTDGQILVRVAAGSAPPPEDTTGSARTDQADNPALERLLSAIPVSGSEVSRLQVLHGLSHQSIHYTRRYFPGTTKEILERGTGDCKAYAQVFCEGARRLGFRARVVHGLLASSDGYYAHAWVTVKTSHGWQDWDPTSSIPFPDARYLRFSTPKTATGAFDGELAIFALDSIAVRPTDGRSTF